MGAVEVAGRHPDHESGLRRSPDFQAFVKAHWPEIKAPATVRRLWREAVADEALVSAAGFDDDEAAALRGRAARGPPTEVDRPCSMANHQLGQRFVQYGHVILDEAQHLSPMALRMVARRARGIPSPSIAELTVSTAYPASSSLSRTDCCPPSHPTSYRRRLCARL